MANIEVLGRPHEADIIFDSPKGYVDTYVISVAFANESSRSIVNVTAFPSDPDLPSLKEAITALIGGLMPNTSYMGYVVARSQGKQSEESHFTFTTGAVNVSIPIKLLTTGAAFAKK